MTSSILPIIHFYSNLSCSSLNLSVVLDSPVISNVMPANAPTIGGASVTLTGTNFGLYTNNDAARSYRVLGNGLFDTRLPFEANVTVGDTVRAVSFGNVAYQSGTSMRVLVPQGLSASIPISIGLSGRRANDDKLPFYTVRPGVQPSALSYDAPVVTATAPMNGPTSGRATVTFSGMNLGVANVVSSMSFGPSACFTAEWLSDSQVKCSAPPGMGNRFNAAITISSRITTFNPRYGYDDRHIYTCAAWGACSATCINDDEPLSSVAQQRQCQCIEKATGKKTVDDVLCAARLRPPERQVCRTASCSPSLLSSFPSHSSAGSVVRLQGRNFGRNNASNVVIRIGNITCMSSSWISHREVRLHLHGTVTRIATTKHYFGALGYYD